MGSTKIDRIKINCEGGGEVEWTDSGFCAVAGRLFVSNF